MNLFLTSVPLPRPIPANTYTGATTVNVSTLTVTNCTLSGNS